MDVLQMVALRHGMVALLHEKPFAGVNGSGKHDNWSFAIEDGINLYVFGNDLEENLQFFFFLIAFKINFFILNHIIHYRKYKNNIGINPYRRFGSNSVDIG